MIGVVVLALAAFLMLMAAVSVAWWSSQPRALGSRMRQQLIVTLKSGESFAGVLFEADAGLWVLRNATALGAGDRDTDVTVDGEVLILVADIAYAQKP